MPVSPVRVCGSINPSRRRTTLSMPPLRAPRRTTRGAVPRGCRSPAPAGSATSSRVADGWAALHHPRQRRTNYTKGSLADCNRLVTRGWPGKSMSIDEPEPDGGEHSDPKSLIGKTGIPRRSAAAQGRDPRCRACITRPTDLCARHVVTLEGASPLRAVMTGTARLGKGARREAGSEGSRCQNSDSTNRNRIQGRPGGVTRQWTGTPESHPDTRAGRSGEARGTEPQLTPGDLRPRPGEPDHRVGDEAGQGRRSQPRP